MYTKDELAHELVNNYQVDPEFTSARYSPGAQLRKHPKGHLGGIYYIYSQDKADSITITNYAYFLRELKRFIKGATPTVIETQDTHWCGGIQLYGFWIQIYTNDKRNKTTKAFDTFYEILEKQDDYYILDESAQSDLAWDMGYKNVCECISDILHNHYSFKSRIYKDIIGEAIYPSPDSINKALCDRAIDIFSWQIGFVLNGLTIELAPQFVDHNEQSFCEFEEWCNEDFVESYLKENKSYIYEKTYPVGTENISECFRQVLYNKRKVHKQIRLQLNKAKQTDPDYPFDENRINQVIEACEQQIEFLSHALICELIPQYIGNTKKGLKRINKECTIESVKQFLKTNKKSYYNKKEIELC